MGAVIEELQASTLSTAPVLVRDEDRTAAVQCLMRLREYVIHLPPPAPHAAPPGIAPQAQAWALAEEGSEGEEIVLDSSDLRAAHAAASVSEESAASDMHDWNADYTRDSPDWSVDAEDPE